VRRAAALTSVLLALTAGACRVEVDASERTEVVARPHDSVGAVLARQVGSAPDSIAWCTRSHLRLVYTDAPIDLVDAGPRMRDGVWDIDPVADHYVDEARRRIAQAIAYVALQDFAKDAGADTISVRLRRTERGDRDRRQGSTAADYHFRRFEEPGAHRAALPPLTRLEAPCQLSDLLG
jgi:hypothetical protein